MTTRSPRPDVAERRPIPTDEEKIEECRRAGMSDWRTNSYMNGWRKPAPERKEQP